MNALVDVAEDDSFLRAVLARPGERGPLLVWADRLDEAGDSAGALGLRWAAKYRRCPASPHLYFISWRRLRAGAWLDNELPSWLFSQMFHRERYRVGWYMTRHFGSLAAAWSAYLAGFREAVRLGRYPRHARVTKAEWGLWA